MCSVVVKFPSHDLPSEQYLSGTFNNKFAILKPRALVQNGQPPPGLDETFIGHLRTFNVKFARAHCATVLQKCTPIVLGFQTSTVMRNKKYLQMFLLQNC